MKVSVGQALRVPASLQASQPGDFFALCKGSYQTGVNPNRGIFYYAAVESPTGVPRIPAFLLYSDNLYGLSERNPWLDVIDPDDGYALYHGDNKKPGTPPLTADGNRTIMQIAHQYADADLRKLAPPMILFERARVQGRSGSYRRFVGYGVPRDLRIQSQRSSLGTFTNLAIDLVLFNLTAEGERFDWHWVDQRRNQSLTPDEALQAAPMAWQQWVVRGDSALETSRRRVFGAAIRTPSEQFQAASADDHSLVRGIYDFFNTTASAYAFEGLASWVASRILGPSCSRGWVTPRVDGGIDFVSRLDLGSGFSKTVVVVLGQAKCIKPGSTVAGIDLARTVARLKRGWIGVVVTTGTFSVRAQQEVLADQYPLVLINGLRLAQEVRSEMVRTGLTLEDLLQRETAWYQANQRMLAPDRVAFGDHWGQRVNEFP